MAALRNIFELCLVNGYQPVQHIYVEVQDNLPRNNLNAKGIL